MTCREIIKLLDDYVAGELSTDRRKIFDDHLAICPACVNYLDTYRATISMGRAAFEDPQAPVPEQVPEDLIRAILDAQNRDDSQP